MKVELTEESRRVLQMLVDIGAYASIEEAANARIARAEERRRAAQGTPEEIARRQYEAHLRLMDLAREAVVRRPPDGLSNRDHDKLIYGE